MSKEKESGAVTVVLAGAMALSVLLMTPDIIKAETVPWETTVQTRVEETAIQDIPGEILAQKSRM